MKLKAHSELSLQRSANREGLRANALGKAAGSAAPARVRDSQFDVGQRAAPVIRRRMTFSYDVPPGTQLAAVTLKGSWGRSGQFSESWADSHLPMSERPVGSGHWEAPAIDLRDDGQVRPWRWGVDIQTTAEAEPKWGMAALQGVPFDPRTGRAKHTPVTYHLNGARRQGQDLTFRAWFPDIAHVSVKVGSAPNEVRFPLDKDESHPGWWQTRLPKAFAQFEGQPYVYELHCDDGRIVERIDMSAIEMQGEQRGLRRFYLDVKAGEPVSEYWHWNEPDQRAESFRELLWFNVDDSFAGKAKRVFVVLKDEHGEPLTRAKLRERLGAFDATAVKRARKEAFNDFWDTSGSDADTRFEMLRVDGAFTLLMQNPDALEGLRYEFRTADGKLLGDVDGDGALNAKEKTLAANDPWANVITAKSGRDFRHPVIRDLSAPLPLRQPGLSSAVYQLHPASFFSSAQNVNRATWEDVIAGLDYLKELGITDIQTLPVSEVEGTSWGYEGVSVLAMESSLGFVDRQARPPRWVSGEEAYRRFVAAAHERGLNVIVDVVLNHLHDNVGALWDLDASGSNPYFNTRPDGAKPPQYFDTAWGKAPAFNRETVSQFLFDYVMRMRMQFGVDGVRFDFTRPIVDAGGADLLRRVNSLLDAYGANIRVAEHFDYEPWVTEEIGKGGLGFTHQLYLAPNHQLVDDSNRLSLLGKAAERHDPGDPLDIDGLMRLLTQQPEGFLSGFADAVVGWTTHDEVGNGARLANVSCGYDSKAAERPSQFGRNLARLLQGVGAFSPGKFMLFQGEESLASNPFKWGIPPTWSSDDAQWLKLGPNWNWDELQFNDAQQAQYVRLFELPRAAVEKDATFCALSPVDRQIFDFLYALPPDQRAKTMHGIARKQMSLWVKDVLALRKEALGSGGTVAERIYTHNRDGLLAFRRPSPSGDLLVIANMGKENQLGRVIGLPSGRWTEVLNSDAHRYGGDNFGNAGATLSGDDGINIPRGGIIVLRQATPKP